MNKGSIVDNKCLILSNLFQNIYDVCTSFLQIFKFIDISVGNANEPSVQTLQDKLYS